MNEEEINLIQSAINGDKTALIELLRNYEQTIYTMLFYLNKNTNDINDIAQDILVKISKKITQLKNAMSFKTWLNQIIINSYYDYLRKNKKLKLNSEINSQIIDKKLIDPQESILYWELDKVIKKSIENLPIHYKIPITLREIQGMSYQDISGITKTSINTIKSRISRARSIIKNQIKQYESS